ncbi:hypothetical protein EBU71_07925 [bacterium]|nr:hypothetical protein [Candidatus Elulimicrobium humile]
MIINLYAILKWFERTWRLWIGLLFVANVGYLVHLYKEQTPPIALAPVEDKVLLDRIQALEKQVQDQQKVIVWYDSYIQNLQSSIKRLDKNQQMQIEVLKRMCEYIWVITIDKKIAPRQCYPEYNWRREEINGN